MKTRLLVPGVVLTLLPLLVVLGVVVNRQLEMGKNVGEGLTDLAFHDLENIANSVTALCETQDEVLQKSVDGGLNVTKKTISSLGSLGFGEEKVSWQAVNQYTNKPTTVQLPKMLVGDQWLGQNAQSGTASLVVDEVKQQVGGTATIFQRMNTAGDMLRVSTNVLKSDGQRAIGTYIPAVNPDGTANPVVSKVLSGETFRGRAFVVDRWYLTAYEPIKDASGSVVGINYFGVPMESATALRQAIMDIPVGK
nr:Cache 3/Cache 2 fusion domain-containing protein [Candidatus Krumholzibacteria bacterium]